MATVTAPTYTDASLGAGTYSYKVTAVDSSGVQGAGFERGVRDGQQQYRVGGDHGHLVLGDHMHVHRYESSAAPLELRGRRQPGECHWFNGIDRLSVSYRDVQLPRDPHR